MKTKIVHLPLLLLTALAAVSFARADEPPAGPPPGPPGEHGGRPRLEHRLQQLDETLQLTASQKEQIKAIWAQAAEQGKALRADDAAAREARRTKGMEVLKATRAKVRAVLTPAQPKIFDTLPAEGRRGRGPRPAGADAPPPPR